MKSKKSKKKPPPQGLDDKTSCRSKRTKSDNKVSVHGGKGLESSVVNLKAMKGSLKKKGADKAKPKDAKQQPRSQQLLLRQQTRELLGSWSLPFNTTSA